MEEKLRISNRVKQIQKSAIHEMTRLSKQFTCLCIPQKERRGRCRSAKSVFSYPSITGDLAAMTEHKVDFFCGDLDFSRLISSLIFEFLA